MRLLLDENVTPRLARALREFGDHAVHANDADLDATPDPTILGYAAANRYDAIITRDGYDGPSERRAAVDAMRRGLRIVELRFRSNERGSGRAQEQIQLVTANRAAIQRAVSAGSPTRKLVLSGTTMDVARTVELADI